MIVLEFNDLTYQTTCVAKMPVPLLLGLKNFQGHF